jgi:diguanylate cyclase
MSVILRDLGYTVSQFHGNLMSELTDVEYYLKNIAIRLKELQLGIEDSYKDQRESLDEQESLNSGFSEQVVAIAAQLADEHDLNQVKHLIDEGLDEIRARMHDHLARDRRRVATGEKRLRDLSERLQKMGEESSRLRDQVCKERDRAQRDPLTGIPNRAAYDERIATEIARRNRHGRHVSLAVIDIDRFKNVNDRFGHRAGDKVLKNVAEICAANVRATDFLARYGGEEFVLVLPESTLAQAHRVAEKLREDVARKRFYYNSIRVPITVSVGVAECARAESAEDVFQRADRALYAAKERGRNRCVTESETD